MRFGSEPPPARLIPLTPLIDVVFILLIFFMLASSFLDWRALDLNISAPGRATESKGRAVLILLKADGSLLMNGKATKAEDLISRIEARIAENPKQTVVIRPEEEVPLQRAIDTIDLLKRAGALEISLSKPR